MANISGVLGEMFRFLYSRIICGPCLFFKKRRAKARKEKIQEETGISSNQPRPSVWRLENDINQKIQGKNSMDQNEDIDEELRRNQQTAVPLTVTMIIISGYIAIGAVIFHNFETWTMVQAAYFCFITLGKKILTSICDILSFFLATIGFGDFVSRRKDV